MENLMIAGVWIIAILVSFVPMPFIYKVIGIIISIILITVSTYLARKKNALSTTSLIINLVIIGWDLAVLYMALTSR